MPLAHWPCAMSTAAAPTSAPSAPSAGRSSKIVPAFLVLNSLLLVGVLAVLILEPAILSKGKEADATVAAPQAAAAAPPAVTPDVPGPIVRLPDFVVRLRNPETDRFARMSFEVELRDEQSKSRLADRMPRIRDAFIAYLSDRTLEELRGSEGLARTKSGLTLQLHEQLSPSDVRGLYITDFVVQ